MGSRRAGSGRRSSRLCRGGVDGGSSLASGKGAKPLVVRGRGAAARAHSRQPPRGLPALHQQGAALQAEAVETRPSPMESWWAQLRRQPRLVTALSKAPYRGQSIPFPLGALGSPSRLFWLSQQRLHDWATGQTWPGLVPSGQAAVSMGPETRPEVPYQRPPLKSH